LPANFSCKLKPTLPPSSGLSRPGRPGIAWFYLVASENFLDGSSWSIARVGGRRRRAPANHNKSGGGAAGGPHTVCTACNFADTSLASLWLSVTWL
jgi:hypothetical protein